MLPTVYRDLKYKETVQIVKPSFNNDLLQLNIPIPKTVIHKLSSNKLPLESIHKPKM